MLSLVRTAPPANDGAGSGRKPRRHRCKSQVHCASPAGSLVNRMFNYLKDPFGRPIPKSGAGEIALRSEVSDASEVWKVSEVVLGKWKSFGYHGDHFDT